MSSYVSEADGPDAEQRRQRPVGAELIREVGLLAVLREDLRFHRGELLRPGLQALFVYRIGVWATTLPSGLSHLVSLIYVLGQRFCRNFYGIELMRTARIGRRFVIGHQHGIVIHQYATFGDDCSVRHGVTFGIGTGWEPGQGPVIGNNVSFAPGAIVLGNVTIGDNVSVGPNCVITTDVPADRSLFIPPPRVIPRASS